MTIRIDSSEVGRLVVDLGRVAARVVDDIEPVMKRGAQNIKDDMVADARGSRHFEQVARTISYDRADGLRTIGYDIGPDRARGGGAGLAGAYLGWARGGATLDLDGPVRAEEPRLVREIEAAVTGLFR